MKQGWEYKKFTDVCDVLYGYAFDSKYFTDDENAMPLIRIRDVMRGYSETFYNGYFPEGFTINEGDYLVGMDGEFNIGRWGKIPGLLNQRVCKMKSSSPLLNNQYMYYFLKVCLKGIEDETPFVTVKHLSAKRINQIQIPLPPLSIQQSIVAELDEINNLLQLKKKELETFDKLAQSIFYEMFGDPVTNEKGWEVKNFGEIGTFLRGKNIQKSDFVKEGMPCIHYGQVHTKFGKMIYSHLTEIPKSVYDKSIIASKGDIIIAITSEDLAGSCKSTAWLGNYDVAVSAHAAVFNHSENPLYIVYYINSSRFRAEKEKYARGFKVMEIKTKDIAKIPITLPPLALQNEFANRIQAIEQQKEQVKASINKLETLLASRMQYWFD